MNSRRFIFQRRRLRSVGHLLMLWTVAALSQLSAADDPQTRLWGDQGDGTYRNPILAADYSDPDVIDVNQLIKPLADEQTVFYFDLFSKMSPQGKSRLGIGHDNLHLTPAGYEWWASEMQPLLDKLLQPSN